MLCSDSWTLIPGRHLGFRVILQFQQRIPLLLMRCIYSKHEGPFIPSSLKIIAVSLFLVWRLKRNQNHSIFGFDSVFLWFRIQWIIYEVSLPMFVVWDGLLMFSCWVTCMEYERGPKGQTSQRIGRDFRDHWFPFDDKKSIKIQRMLWCLDRKTCILIPFPIDFVVDSVSWTVQSSRVYSVFVVPTVVLLCSSNSILSVVTVKVQTTKVLPSLKPREMEGKLSGRIFQIIWFLYEMMSMSLSRRTFIQSRL
jgi:hypothetical protein